MFKPLVVCVKDYDAKEQFKYRYRKHISSDCEKVDPIDRKDLEKRQIDWALKENKIPIKFKNSVDVDSKVKSFIVD